MVEQRMHEPRTPQNGLQTLTKEKRNWSRQDKPVYLSNLRLRASKTAAHQEENHPPSSFFSRILALKLYKRGFARFECCYSHRS